MARVCEVCGRREERPDEDHPFDILDVCESCTDDIHMSND
jgi:hypothetical protein